MARDTNYPTSNADGGKSTLAKKAMKPVYIFRRERCDGVQVPMNIVMSNQDGHRWSKVVHVKASIDIHGHLKEQRCAVDGGRRKVDTRESGLCIDFPNNNLL